MEIKTHSLICDYLAELGVPFTENYSNRRYDSMPFKTLYGFSKVLEDYGVQSEGYFLADKSEFELLTPPFIASTPKGLTIVTSVTPCEVTYMSQGVVEKMPSKDYLQAWDGYVLLSYPHEKACEPDYALHRRLDFFNMAKKWILLACIVMIFAYLFIINDIYSHASTIFITIIDLAGLYFTFLLVQKSLNFHNSTADKVCGVLQAGGCDSILELKASKFFGLFGWSEVGFSYFSVSLLTILLFPSMLPWLALCNACCLPFTFWSIWYQRFKAHKWCTLCVSVQASLWVLFFCYLFGGWLRLAWPPAWSLVILGATYLAVMLAINALMPFIRNKN
ncbi:MAG: vitamin K epoxide reductase family protein [Clostridiales bacterium]|nr:vitamin K epoxide reductase family protein [Clostridiales bacterium]